MPVNPRRAARVRSDRSGYREEPLDQATLAALQSASESIVGDNREDPAEIVRQISDFFAALDPVLDQYFSTVRLDAIAALREAGMAYDLIASKTGLSRERVAQLAREAKARKG